MADDRMKVSSQQAALVFADLLDSLIVDVASESHRAARLGFDYKLNVEEEEEVRLAHHARTVVGDSGAIGSENGNKHTIDVFGQTHPTIANETFDCMNCGRPIVAGRFAPHLEKCMGKGRKARLKASRNMTATQQRRARSTPIPSYGGVASVATATRTPNRTPTRTPEEPQRGHSEATDGTSEESHDDDDEKDEFFGLSRSGKARSKKVTGRLWKSRRGRMMQLSASSIGPFPLPAPSPGEGFSGASVASLPGGTDNLPGSEEGLTVEVAVEQFNSLVGGKVPTSGDMAFANGRNQHSGARILNLVGDKERLGLVLADGSVVRYCGGTRRSIEGGWQDPSEEHNAETRTQCAVLHESVPGLQQQTDVNQKVKNDSVGELYRNGDNYTPNAAGTNESMGIVSRQQVTSMAITAVSRKEQNGRRLERWKDPNLRPKLHLSGDNGDVVGVKREKPLRATSKPKHCHGAAMAPTPGGGYGQVVDMAHCILVEVLMEKGPVEIGPKEGLSHVIQEDDAKESGVEASAQLRLGTNPPSRRQ